MHHTSSPGRRHADQLSRGRWFFANASGKTSQPSSALGHVGYQTNLILPAPSQDPQVTWFNGQYYYCESTVAGIFLRVAHDFLCFAQAPQICVWKPKRRGPCSKNIWAPELHIIQGRPYIYFAADDGKNANHRMWVLEGLGEDPLDEYRPPVALETQGWAIDGTLLSTPVGENFFVWSGWPGRKDGQQNLYLSRMTSPTELSGRRILLATPDQSWERQGMPICEGPQILRRNGQSFIVYSASASWTSDYCLGLLRHEGGDLADPKNWEKTGPVFASNEHALGVGHCGFLHTPEGEEWMFYHAKKSAAHGWNDREVRAQTYSWTHDGRPDLGEPVSRHQPLWRSNFGKRLAS